jgi:DNA-binding protein HU-beta
MNKAALSDAIAERTGLSKKQAEDFLEAFVATVTQTMVSGEEVTITGFGTFMPKHRSARMGVNPQNPTERIHVPAVIIPKFKAGKGLKDALKAVPTE